jgi:hypothetical protein
MSGRLPTYVVLGAAKAGTTALHHYLGQHPDVYASPRKETNFFCYWQDRSDYYEPFPQSGLERITTSEQYLSLFAGASGQRALGEASPWYLFHPEAPHRLHSFLPDARLLVILRDPVERAYANFGHNVRDGKEPYPIDDFEGALDDERTRLDAGWHPLVFAYRDMGFYAAQLKRYLAHFPREQVEILLFDDFTRDPQQVVSRAFSFVGVDPDISINTSLRLNVTGLPRRRWIHDMIRANSSLKRLVGAVIPAAQRRRLKAGLLQSNLAPLPPLPPTTAARLREVYREDTLQLQELLDRNLTSWLA